MFLSYPSSYLVTVPRLQVSLLVSRLQLIFAVIRYATKSINLDFFLIFLSFPPIYFRVVGVTHPQNIFSEDTF